MTRSATPLSFLLLFAAGLLSVGCAGISVQKTAGLRSDEVARPITVEPIDREKSRVPFREWNWPDDQRMVSAGRMRMLRLESSAGFDPDREVRRLENHFKAVLEWLESREETSLQTALIRLEEHEGRTFGEIEKARVLQDLREARYRQIGVLREYASRGRFPRNDREDGTSTPIFVDESDTACAVGYLMRQDGRAEDVLQIAKSQNRVYVPDVRDGPVVDWVASSGLILEEAAVIQPTYAPPPGPGDVALDDLSLPGASVEVGGLRIENFSVQVFDIASPAGRPIATQTLANTLLEVGAPGDLYIEGNGGSISSFLDPAPWLFWNAGPAGGFLSSPANPSGLEFKGLTIAFDVSPTQAGTAIDAALLSVCGFCWGGAESSGSGLRVAMEVRDSDNALLASYLIGDQPADFFNPLGQVADPLSASETSSFSPQQSVSVTISGNNTVFSDQPLIWNQFQQEFRLVPIPEPGTAMMFGLGLGVLVSIRKRATRRRDR